MTIDLSKNELLMLIKMVADWIHEEMGMLKETPFDKKLFLGIKELQGRYESLVLSFEAWEGNWADNKIFKEQE